MEALFRDWVELPVNIVDLIVTKLDSFSAYSRFCGVCSRWRCIAHEDNPDYKVKKDIVAVSRKKLPMLMFLTDDNSDRRSLFDVTNRKTYDIKLPLSFKYRFGGSSRGWLLCLGKNMVLTLVNPCTNACVSLPVFNCPCSRAGGYDKKYFDDFFKKGALMSNPQSSDPSGFDVAVIYGGAFELAYYKSSEASWKFLEIGTEFYAVDIISYKGKFYAVNSYSKLVEINTTYNTMNTIIPPKEYDPVLLYNVYLVESQDGELLLVKRFWKRFWDFVDDDDDESWKNISSDESSDGEYDSSDVQRIIDMGDAAFPLTYECKVFKMTHSLEDGLASWVEMTNIGEQALFVGDNHSVSVSTIEFPGCMKNSVYFTTEHHRMHYPYAYRGVHEDARIYNLEDKSLHDHHVLEDGRKYMQPPIWFVLNPQ